MFDVDASKNNENEKKKKTNPFGCYMIYHWRLPFTLPLDSVSHTLTHAHNVCIGSGFICVFDF